MDYKKFINLEVTNFCNYKCSKCLHAKDYFPRERGFLTNENLEKIIKKLPSTMEYIGLSGIGEPLMNKNLFSIIKNIQDKLPNVKVGFHTNGSLLNSENIENICKSNIYDISISIDAATDETYKLVHKTNCTLSMVLENVLSLKKQLKNKNKKTLLSVSYVIQKENLGELPVFIKKMHSLGLENIGPINVVSCIHGYTMDDWENPYSDVRDEINNAKKIASKLNINVKFPEINESKVGSTNINHLENYSCAFPLSLYPIVTWNANVFPCIWLHNNDVLIGNLIDDSIEDILDGKKITKIRDIFRRGSYLEFCKNCKTKGFPQNEMKFEKI
ncbi:radical SAM protein [Clostridium perfringens]|uniref:radical SAM protein n=1 Tax=Clostridium perfringens TaxID=1502 RepID=UPI0018E4042C|nr:radical SAM protein [Clostridium perfringens]MBI6039878.1 radical SAM protein [Clostridium perfringens]